MKRKIFSILFVCMFVLSACGKEDVAEEEQNVEEREVVPPYELRELSLPDSLMSENVQGSDYIGNDFNGFVADIQGKPAVYYSSFSFEDEDYVASITRWTLDDKENWNSEELCQNSLSEFLNQKFEQVSWKRCHLNNFRRGDNGNLYAVFTYYIKQNVDMGEESAEMLVEKYCILEIDEENDSIFEIPLEIGPSPYEDTGMGWETDVEWISDYHIFEDGSILILSSDNGGGYGYLIDGESGKVSDEIGNVVSGKRRFVFGEGEIIFYSNSSKRFQVLDIPGMAEANTFGSQLGEDVLGRDWYFYMDPDTWELFMCNKSGVYRAVSYQTSDEVECLTEKTNMSEIEQTDSEILDFFVGEDEDFYICMMETLEEFGMQYNRYRIVHYVK